MLTFLVVAFAWCRFANGVFYVHPSTDPELLLAAQSLGESAKINYISSVVGVTDTKRKHDFYLDGLEVCNNIGSRETERTIQRAETESRREDARLLEEMGLKEFTAQFMTVPVQFMKEIAHMACSKHEQQLQCGSVFEGDDITRRRVEDLRTIGNHRMMFDFECVNSSFVPGVYPCIGREVAAWSASCREDMDNYWNVRESVNRQISSIYESALKTVKKLKSRVVSQDTLQQFIVHDAMRNIASLEGDKCARFKKMRSCVLPLLGRQCGATAAAAVDTSISMGYLRTERRERLELDFRNLQYSADPRCSGL